MCFEVGLDMACCAGFAFCNLFARIFGTSFKQNVRMGYTLQMTLLALFMLVFLFYISPNLTWIEDFGICAQKSSDNSTQETCLGVYGVYRLSSVFFLVHLAIMLSCFERGSFAKLMNEGCWALKILLIIAMFIGTLWIPNSFYVVYRDIAEGVSFVYLLFQFIFIIDFAYLWASSWFEKASDGNNFYVVCLYVFTIFFYGSWVALMYFMYSWFWSWSCWGNNSLLIVLTLLVVVLTGLNVAGFNKSASILKASFMMIFLTYLAW